MRTTVRLDDELFAAAKAQAAKQGATLTVVIEEALRERLSRIPPTGDAAPVELPTFAGDGLQPGAQAGARGNLVTDAYLAALAIESGCELVSMDRDFSRFEGLSWTVPR